MAYQPLYAKISDNAGGYAHSLCLRGRVDNINMWLNSWFGEVLNVSDRLVDGKQIVSRPDLRKVKKEKRDEALKNYEEDASKENRIIMDIEIPANRAFNVRINGVELSYDRIKLMEDMKNKRMDMQIKSMTKIFQADKKMLQVAQVMLQ